MPLDVNPDHMPPSKLVRPRQAPIWFIGDPRVPLEYREGARERTWAFFGDYATIEEHQAACDERDAEINSFCKKKIREQSPEDGTIGTPPIAFKRKRNNNVAAKATIRRKLKRAKAALRTTFREYGLTRRQQRSVCKSYITDTLERDYEDSKP